MHDAQLSAEEEAAFEMFCREHPEMYHYIDAVLRLKEGLAELTERGELRHALRPQRPRVWILAAAAAIAATVIGAWVWRGDFRPTIHRPTSHLVVLSADRWSLPVASTYYLVKSRGANAEISLESPRRGVIQLRILPTAPPTARLRVTLSAVGESAPGAFVGEAADLRPAPDGYVTVYLNPTHLAAGKYELIVTAPPGTDGYERFVLTIKDSGS